MSFASRALIAAIGRTSPCSAAGWDSPVGYPMARPRIGPLPHPQTVRRLTPGVRGAQRLGGRQPIAGNADLMEAATVMDAHAGEETRRRHLRDADDPDRVNRLFKLASRGDGAARNALIERFLPLAR